MVNLIMNTNKKVQILLSTYNGEKFLEEQLDSIIKQDYPYISILIRDDGSTDDTINIIKRYCKSYKNISYYQGKNLGVIGSFFDLIKRTNEEYDYFAFCDQDDIWKYNKISRALEKLENLRTKVRLYCSNLILVDQYKQMYKKQRLQKKNPSFGNAMIENICTGCTAVCNLELLNYLKNIEYQNIIMHDWWLYLVASCFGEVYFDEEPFVLYRQHGSNVVGTTNNFFKKTIKRIKTFDKNNLSNQISYFYICYQNIITNEKKKSIQILLNYKSNKMYKFKLLLHKKIKRQSSIDNFLFKILFLFNLK